MTIRLTARDPDLNIALSDASALFATDAEETLPLDVIIDSPPQPRGPVVFESGAVWRLHADANTLDIETFTNGQQAPYRVARIAADLSCGEIVLNPDNYERSVVAHPLEYPLDELLFVHLLSRGRGVELHGCGLVADGRGSLFVGQSGAGKSTTARLWQQRCDPLILSDDRIIVRKSNDEFWMYGTPWHGEAELAAAAGARLDHIFLLRQAPRNAIAELPPPIAVSRLFACAFPLFYDSSAIDFTLSLLGEIVQRVPVVELQFVPDISAVDLLRQSER